MLNSFLKLLRGEPAERVVWTADLNYWLFARQQQSRGDPAWDTEEGYLQFHRSLGVMPYYYYGRFWLGEPRYSSRVHLSSETDGPRTIARIETPVGTLTQVLQYLPTSYSTGAVKHYVANEDDLDVLLYVLEQRTLVPACLDDYPERMHLWESYGGLPSIALPRAPLAALAYEWAGVEHMVYLLMDCPDKVQAALRLMAEQEQPIVEAVCRAAPPLVHFADNLSSANLGGLYGRYMADHHRWRIGRLHAAGVRCVVHLDGTVKGLLAQLVQVGFDGIEALTPKPVGDLDAAEMSRLAGQRVILWGGVPGAMFAPPYTWPDMEAHVRAVLAAWRGRPFVLGVADQVPPDGDITFCSRIAELVAGCGGP